MTPTETITPWVKSWPAKIFEKPAKRTEHASPGNVPADLRELQHALAAIPNEGSGLDYDAWRNIIFGIHFATDGSDEGLAIAVEFSERSNKHDEDTLLNRVWPYIRSDRGGPVITERTILALARQHGWREDVAAKFDVLEDEEAAPTDGGAATNAESTTPAVNRFRVLTHAQARQQLREPSYLIQGVVPKGGVTTTIGAPGSAKTFMAVDQAGAVSLGADWRGLKTEKVRVVYVAAEDAVGVRLRMDAYARHHNLPELPIGIIPDAPNLLLVDDVRDLITAIRAFGSVGLIVIDTMAQASAGADENSGKDMGKVLAHCKAIHKATGGTVMLVHHVGKDAAKGSRGWSGILGAVDAELTVERGKAGDRELVVTKMKNGQDGARFPFRLHRVVLNEAEVLADGADPVDSCVVEHLDAGQRRPETKEPSGKWQKAIWRHLNDLAGPGVGDGVALGELLTAVTEAASEADKPTQKVLNQALAALEEEKQLLRLVNGVVYLMGAE